jgi:hypothetical protein
MSRRIGPPTALKVSAALLVGVSLGAIHHPAPVDTGARMLEAARSYLGTLTTDQREAGSWAFDAEERHDWHFVPRERYGVRLKDMTLEQREAAHSLLASVLSPEGYRKATGVLQLEAILGGIEGRPDRRDPENYWVNVFGTPSADGPWAWRFEGHHISLNFTAAGDELPSVTPRFIGSNPHVVREGPFAGYSMLAGEERVARELMASLSASQRDRAVILAEAPRDIVTGNARRVELDRFEGIPASALDEDQRVILRGLVRLYVDNAAQAVAEHEMRRIDDAGFDRIHFAWAGGTETGEGHYYRIHGPTLFIEYDNVQGGANHVHSVVRDPENDFGDDLLRRHYEEAGHHQGDGAPHPHAHGDTDPRE